MRFSSSSWTSFFVFSRNACEKSAMPAVKAQLGNKLISICLLIFALIYFDRGNEHDFFVLNKKDNTEKTTRQSQNASGRDEKKMKLWAIDLTFKLHGFVRCCCCFFTSVASRVENNVFLELTTIVKKPKKKKKTVRKTGLCIKRCDWANEKKSHTHHYDIDLHTCVARTIYKKYRYIVKYSQGLSGIRDTQ